NTPGFWKNHTNLWDQATDVTSKELAAGVLAFSGKVVDGTTASKFKDVFNLTDAQMTAAGLSTNMTLLQAINLGGGDFQKLARHPTAAILNAANPVVDYPMTLADILTKVRQAIIDLKPEPLATQLADFNNLGSDLG